LTTFGADYSSSQPTCPFNLIIPHACLSSLSALPLYAQPHYSADSPPWARGRFNDLKAPRTPAYNTSVGQKDKAHHVAQNPPLDAEAEKYIDVHFRDRWRAISGVDDMVGLVLDHLEAKNILEVCAVLINLSVDQSCPA
jgi:hypothetical protein